MWVDLQAPEWAAHLLSDLTDWQRQPLPVAELTPFELPDDVYFEYAWRDARGRRLPDPANDNPRLNPWWEYASNLAGPHYRPEPIAEASTGRPQGSVLRMEVASRSLGQQRRVLVYSPAGKARASLPVILFQDGKAYFGWGRAAQILDRLLAGGEIEPAHLVFVPPQERTAEYAFNAVYRKFLLEELLPAVESRIPCDGRRTAWGASLGGLLGAQLAWQRPDLIQQVVAQSGAFLFSEDMERSNPFAGGESFLQMVVQDQMRPIRWHLDCGTLEWLIDSNRRLASALADRGAEVALTTRNAGHNWVSWRNGMVGAFRFALGA